MTERPSFDTSGDAQIGPADITPMRSGDGSAPKQVGRLDDPEDLFPPPTVTAPDEHAFTDFLPPQPPERSIIKRVILLVVGTVFVLIGLILWVTPIIGGAPLFIIPGLILLAKASDPIRRMINHGDTKLPNWARKALRWARDKTSRHPAATSPAESAKNGDTSDSAPTRSSARQD
jgi:hypothetical protein